MCGINQRSDGKELQMHFVVSWDLRAQGNLRTEVHNAMREGLRGYSWLCLLPAFYIVDVNSEQDWHAIHKNLLSVAQKYSGEVNFLMGPVYDSDSDYFVYQMPENDFYHPPSA